MQESWNPPVQITGSEDCLYLNIDRPRHHSKEPLPVLVWFHGGGWVAGSSQDIDGRAIARYGLIVVTINYRLGALGFYASPELDREARDGVSGNLALRDQQAALGWIRRNIATFGGDPQRVTIAGQSAGALSNWIHLVSPGADGLFSRMIAESPVVSLFPNAGLDDARGVGGTRSLRDEEVRGASAQFAARLDCATATSQLSCLRAKPAADLIIALKPGVPGWGVGWGPVVDGKVLPAPVPELIAAGRYRHAPILTGGNWAENTINSQRKTIFGQPLLTTQDYERIVAALPHGTEILAHYPASKFSSPEDAYNLMRGDARVCINIASAKVMATNSPFYIYQFDAPNGPPTIFEAKLPDTVPQHSFHTAEIPYIFGLGYPNEQHPGVPPLTPAQKQLSNRMMSDWAHFVRTGRPASPDWQAFDQSQSFEYLSPPRPRRVTAAALGEHHNCDFWLRLLSGT